jgi:beta-xylosidase
MSITLNNPIFHSDVPDVDVLRHGNAFYMVSTTMHVLPGCPIMKSTDLVNWEIQSYIFHTVEDNDMYRLENRESNGVYGRGQWATSLRYHNGLFYACFVCNEMKQTYIYYTSDIESGDWNRHVLDGIYHDPSLLFEDDRLFIFYNCGDVRITELLPDASGVKPGGINHLLFSTPKENIGLRCEGCHAYKINGWYYLIFIEWPTDGNQRRREICYRSKELLGPYERKIVLDDDMGYHNKGIAQGAIFDDAAGNWYAMLFQDRDAIGRIPYILPVTWENDWPVFGIDGKVPKSWEVPFEESAHYDMVISDSFNHTENVLANQWQWNHNPDADNWSFTKRPGYLRLTTGCIRDNVLFARNTLTQRTESPMCQATITADVSAMKAGDHCGLIALQSNFGTVGITAKNDSKYIVMTTKEGVQEEIPFSGNTAFFRIHFDYTDSRDIATFFYSLDGTQFTQLGTELKMLYTLDHFMGYRIGIFNYASQETGGYVDFKDFTYTRIDEA